MRCIRDHYGASITNTPAENQDAFMNALAAGPFSIPDETYITDPLVTAVTPYIRGAGRRSGIQTTSTTAPLISIPLTAPSLGLSVCDVSLIGGTMALNVTLETTSAIMMDWTLSGLFCYGQSLRSISLDNFSGKPDGFFTGRLQNSVMDQTLFGCKIGDRITFRDLKITGLGRGIEISSVPGARCSLITESTVVTLGENLFGSDLEGWDITHNHFEHPAYLGDYSGSLAAKVVLHNTYDCNMTRNRVSAQHGSAAPSGPCVGADYDIIVSGAAWETNSVKGNSVGPSKQANRVVNGTGAVIDGNTYN